MEKPQRIVVEGLGRLPQFVHATVSEGLVFVSGTLGTVGDTGLAPGGIGAETTQALRNIGAILAAAGAQWGDVAKINVHLADMAEFDEMNAVYSAFFQETPPARMTIGNVGLALGARVEIDCVARAG